MEIIIQSLPRLAAKRLAAVNSFSHNYHLFYQLSQNGEIRSAYSIKIVID